MRSWSNNGRMTTSFPSNMLPSPTFLPSISSTLASPPFLPSGGPNPMFISTLLVRFGNGDLEAVQYHPHLLHQLGPPTLPYVHIPSMYAWTFLLHSHQSYVCIPTNHLLQRSLTSLLYLVLSSSLHNFHHVVQPTLL